MSKEEQEEKLDKEQLNQQAEVADDNAEAPQDAEPQAEASEEAAQETAEETSEEAPEETPEDKIKALTDELENAKKEHLFLRAEFDNFRKRTIREKAEIIRNGSEKAIEALLPVIDDFERAIKANETADDIQAIKDGVKIIYNKLVQYLAQHQVKAIESTGCDFDTELHEAVTTFPAPSEELKGKVIDTVVTGYTINDKVLRHAKVVVGQ